MCSDWLTELKQKILIGKYLNTVPSEALTIPDKTVSTDIVATEIQGKMVSLLQSLPPVIKDTTISTGDDLLRDIPVSRHLSGSRTDEIDPRCRHLLALCRLIHVEIDEEQPALQQTNSNDA